MISYIKKNLVGIILAIIFSTTLCLTWDAAQKAQDKRDREQKYFPTGNSITISGGITYRDLK